MAIENVGLARLNDGTDLIRIGAPLGPEFAAWRYGHTFGRRRRNRALDRAATAIVGGGASAGLLMTFGLALGSQIFASLLPATLVTGHYMANTVGLKLTRLRVVAGDGSIVCVTGHALRFAMIDVVRRADNLVHDFALNFVDKKGGRTRPEIRYRLLNGEMQSLKKSMARMNGRPAQMALSPILAIADNLSGSRKDLARALTFVDGASSPGSLMRSFPIASYQPRLQRLLKLPHTTIGRRSLSTYARLTLEMSLHEDFVHRALDGALRELARRWKEAAEIAAISDSLLRPDPGGSSEQK